MKQKIIKLLNFLKTNIITTVIVFVITILTATSVINNCETNDVVMNETEPSSEVVTEEITSEPVTEKVVEMIEPITEVITDTQEVTTQAETEQQIVKEDVTEAPKSIYDYCTFTDLEDSYEITKVTDYHNAVLTIPSEYNGKPVTKTGNNFIKGCNGVVVLVLPGTIAEYGNSSGNDSYRVESLDAIICLGNAPFKNPSFCFSVEKFHDGLTHVYVSNYELYMGVWSEHVSYSLLKTITTDLSKCPYSY